MTPMNAIAGALFAAGALVSTAAHSQSVEPGEWESTVQIKSLDMPGLSPEMRKGMTEPKTERDCISAAKAAEGYRTLLRGQGDCTPKRASLVGSAFSGEFVCNGAEGAMTMAVTGTFTPTAYSLDFQTSGSGRRASKMLLNISAKRIGACH